MEDSLLEFGRMSHVLYSRQCRKEIRQKIALHYKRDERKALWEKVKMQYVDFLSSFRTGLGGKKNFHNGKGGTYDCIAIMSYYAVCKSVTSFREIEEMEENLILPSFRKLSGIVNCNKPFWKKLMYRAFKRAEKECGRWHDYEMNVLPYEEGNPICYEFTSCPVAEAAKKFGVTEIMPSLSNADFASTALIPARLIRREPHAWTARNVTTLSVATETIM